MTQQEITNLGWNQLEDRGMSENNGGLYVQGDYELRVWKTFPRFNIQKFGRTVYDSHIDYPVDPANKVEIPQSFLALKMREYGILQAKGI